MEFAKTNWKYIVIFALGVILGCYVTYHYFPRNIIVETLEITKTASYLHRKKFF